MIDTELGLVHTCVFDNHVLSFVHDMGMSAYYSLSLSHVCVIFWQ